MMPTNIIRFALYGHAFDLEVYLLPEDGTKRDFLPQHFLTTVFNPGQSTKQDGETGWPEEQDDLITTYVPLTPFICRRIQQQQWAGQNRISVDKLLKHIYWRIAKVNPLITLY
jgi:hypothetical protein